MSHRPDNPYNIVLMGMRASGKSTVGRALAERVKRPFIDLDNETLAAFGDCGSISEVWCTYGESRFRAAEFAALERVLASSGQVVALGGGTPMTPQGERLIDFERRSGRLVAAYLKAAPELLRQRLSLHAGDRPALRGGDAVEEVDSVLREREPTYERLADIALDAALPLNEQVEMIIRALGSRRESR